MFDYSQMEISLSQGFSDVSENFTFGRLFLMFLKYSLSKHFPEVSADNAWPSLLLLLVNVVPIRWIQEFSARFPRFDNRLSHNHDRSYVASLASCAKVKK